ncbi:hypothetical protein EDD21DRAFT_114220 [Dissophora ornata]|nr:hypothetical protein EDD21DRAFT_114220 [Dissophora ornata]
MPRNNIPAKHSRVDVRPVVGPSSNQYTATSRRSSTGIRKGRLKSHRKGRPPGSGHRARLKQQELQRALDHALGEEHNIHQLPDHHLNHSLLANHPASARHDYGGDDENKPREERSYIEFFPFLSTSLRLDIVDATPVPAATSAVTDRIPAPNSEHPAKETGGSAVVKTEGKDVEMANNTSDKKDFSSNQISHTTAEDVFHDSNEALSQGVPNDDLTNDASSPLTVDAKDTSEVQCNDSNFEDNLDGDATSERDVFFDAKGFTEAEVESINKATTQPGNIHSTRDSHLVVGGVADGVEAMDTDQETRTSSGIAADHKGERDASPNVFTVQDDAPKPTDIEKQAPSSKNGEQPRALTSRKTPSGPSAATVLEPKTPMALLPKSSFRLIPREDDDLEEYHLPAGHNVRYIEPTETELAERVEYDMDEQDEFWLREINEERRKQDLGEVTSSMFEKIIDRLEKEWFDLTKNIPKTTENLPPEDSACNICDDGECENSNAIVFCDGCNLAVHQDCYGIPYIPEGQWLCRKCMLSPQMPVSCIFCPGEGGAFKQTTNSRWAHLLCASWIPEVGVANTVYMEPIDNIDKIPASRWKLTCYICKLRMGACIQCETKNCFRAFHVTCARKAHLYMKSKLSKASNSGGEVLVYRAHCHKHTPRDYKGHVDIAGAAAVFAHKGIKKKRAKIRVLDDDSDDPDYGRSDDDDGSIQRRSSISNGDKGATSSHAASQSLGGSRTSKAALAHQKHYTPGAPLAPMFIVNRLLPFVSKLGAKTPALRKASALNFIYTICKYWSLKRESRRGAPLLKRLHLEPWTASASAHRQTEEEKLKKLQTQVLLRGDLEKVRMLAELVRKRERAKLKRQEFQNRYLCKIMFPLKTILEDTLAELEKLDKAKYFAYPISAEEVKDYHDVIKDPVCFQTMNEKLAAHHYQTVEEFTDDARRIYHNCLTYNKVDTPYYRAATRQLKLAEAHLQKAKDDYEHMEIDPHTGFLDVPIDPEIFTYNLIPFQRSDDEMKPPTQDMRLAGATRAEMTSSKSKRRDTSIDLPRIPAVVARSLRVTSGRTAQAVGSSSLTSSTSTSKAPLDINRALNQTAGFRAPSRSGSRPEAPKLKTATLTRADVAKARLTANEGGMRVDLGEDELLEKLKLKSKKSRSLAVSLQSRLKPSIVDKVVEVINKPAPKGWAYVVVEGEEDTTDEEDETESNQPDMDSETEQAIKAKEEASMRRREERHALALKKKLAKEKKAKARAEAYARTKASKALVAAGGAESGQLLSMGSGEPAAKGNHTATEAISLGGQSNDNSRHTKSKSRRSQPNRSKEAGNLGADATEHESNGASGEGAMAGDTNNIDTHELLPSERPVKDKRRHVDVETGAVAIGFADLDIGDANQVDAESRNGLEDAGDTDDLMEDESAMDAEPPRKRQKRLGPGRVAVKDTPEDESPAGSTRRLRSTEAVPVAPAALGSRRGSSASQRVASKGVGDTAGES